MQISVAPKSTASRTRSANSSGIDLVGVGRAARLAEAAEGAADGADVREVDVAVDDEGRDLAREVGAELVGGGADLLDRLRPRLREQGDELVLGSSSSPVARPLDRRERGIAAAERRSAAVSPFVPLTENGARRGRNVGKRSASTPSTAGSTHSSVHVLRVDAEPLGQRVAERPQPLADLERAREGMLGRDVVAVGGEAAEIGRAGLDELDPPVGEVRRDLDADLGHQPTALGDQPLHVLERDRPRPRRANRPRPRRSRRAVPRPSAAR